MQTSEFVTDGKIHFLKFLKLIFLEYWNVSYIGFLRHFYLMGLALFNIKEHKENLAHSTAESTWNQEVL